MSSNKFKLNKDLAFSGIVLAICAIFLAAGYLLPFSFLLIIVFVPLLCALLSIRISNKILLAFLLGLFCFCLIDIQNGIFYLLPNAIIGLVFGKLIKHSIDTTISFYILVIISFLFNALSYYPIKFIFDVDLIATYANLLNIKRDVFVLIYPIFILLLSQIEFFIMFDIVKEEIKKFNIDLDCYQIDINSVVFMGLIIFLLSIASRFLLENILISISLLGFGLLPVSTSIVELLLITRGWKKYLSLLIPMLLMFVFTILLKLDIKDFYLSLCLGGALYLLELLGVKILKQTKISKHFSVL